IFEILPCCQAITFVSQSEHIEKILAEKVQKEQLSGLEPMYLYPSLTKQQREDTFAKFRKGAGPLDKVKYVEEKNEEKKGKNIYRPEETIPGGFQTAYNRLLITSDDYARYARKNPIPYASLVLCYDCPSTKEGYLHRIACCGRGGKRGVAISLIGAGDKQFLEDLQHFGLEIEELPENFSEAIEIAETDDLFGPTEKPLEMSEPNAKARKSKKKSEDGEEEA
ncbi:ATP-dependent RNA helicase FAL1, partial [Diplonema papillatum]